MTVYTCNICKAQYSHDQAYRHFLDCSWQQIKAAREVINYTIPAHTAPAGYGLRLDQGERPR